MLGKGLVGTMLGSLQPCAAAGVLAYGKLKTCPARFGVVDASCARPCAGGVARGTASGVAVPLEVVLGDVDATESYGTMEYLCWGSWNLRSLWRNADKRRQLAAPLARMGLPRGASDGEEE